MEILGNSRGICACKIHMDLLSVHLISICKLRANHDGRLLDFLYLDHSSITVSASESDSGAPDGFISMIYHPASADKSEVENLDLLSRIFRDLDVWTCGKCS